MTRNASTPPTRNGRTWRRAVSSCATVQHLSGLAGRTAPMAGNAPAGEPTMRKNGSPGAPGWRSAWCWRCCCCCGPCRWRDLDALRNATLRMGRERPRRARPAVAFSGIRHVGESFNQMAERIAALVDNQRSMTNAVSHELRTPLARLSFEVDMLGQSCSVPGPPRTDPAGYARRHQRARRWSTTAGLRADARPTTSSSRKPWTCATGWRDPGAGGAPGRARGVRCHVREGLPALLAAPAT